MSALARRLLRLLPLTRPHEGLHQTRARGSADTARPARPATTLLAGPPPERQAWCLPPPAKRRQRVTGTLPADVTGQWKRERGNAS